MQVPIETVTNLSSRNANTFFRESKNHKAGNPDDSDGSNSGSGSNEGESDIRSIHESDRTF